MNRPIAFALGLALLPLAVASADPGDRAYAARTRGLAAGAAKVESRVEALTTRIRWETSLEAALARGRREGKPVFWMNMLGRLDGTT
ncbi:MAG: hypothetical protein L0216_17130 [Planctomycetales bacterium]|nr:hypothetical protein [Planctomycetales bacterium]